MKKMIPILIIITALLGLCLSGATAYLAYSGGTAVQMYQAMLAAALIFGLLLVVCILTLILRQKKYAGTATAVLVCVIAVLQALLLVFCFMTHKAMEREASQQPVEETTTAPTETTVPPTTEEATVPPTTEPPVTEPSLQAAYTDNSDPDNWNTKWEIMVNGEIVESYTREEPISFEGNDYFSLPGVATFRGNNYRSDAVYGTAQVADAQLTTLWHKTVGHNIDPHWCGCGWTGQPLVVQWDEETKAIMNLYPEAKAKEGLIELIYAKMDGYIHFFDMETGEPTRDAIHMGMCFKGAGALDPRGYPLLYVGSGINESGKPARMFVVSLITGEILWEHSGKDSFTNRGWYAFDSSPLVDAETDTLIWPGENGILYTFKLNTQYDKAAGTISVTPDEAVKTRYSNKYSSAGRSRGYESSAVVVQNYLYVGDNCGMLYCVDLNTMALVWTQDVKDDVNSSPLFDWGEDGRGYIYVAPSLEYMGSKAEVPIYKLDAQTGEIIWTHSLTCGSYNDISGGALATPLLGREGSDIEDLIIFTMGRSPGAWDGQMIAFNKETGEVVWQTETDNYAWSSPVAIYTDEGKSYIFQADASGKCCMYDGLTGQLLTSQDLGQTVEASPVVFGNYLVLGTRSGMYGFKIS